MEEDYYAGRMVYFILPILSLMLYLYCNFKLNYWRKRGVPQLLNTNKIFGDFKDGILFRTGPGYHLGNIYSEAPSNAPYIGFYIFHKPCLLLRDPEIIKQVLIKDFDNFTNRHFAGTQQKDSIGMKNLFGLKDPAWRYLRKKITPTLTRNKVKQWIPLMIDTGKPMMDYLSKSSDDHNNNFKVIDAQDLNYKYTADIIAGVALGTKTDSFNFPDSDYSRYLMSFFHSLKRMVAVVIVYFIPELSDAIGSPILFDSSLIKKMFWEALEHREKSGKKRGDFIDSIIQLKNGKQDDLFKFEGDNLLYLSGTFFSGFESNATVSTFTLMELAKDNSYQEKAREDIKKAIDKFGWTMEAFNDMKYLDQCIAEGIRKYPPVSTIDRYPLKDYKIPNTNLTIEKGTPIFISLCGLHGDSKIFESPELFNPERFRTGGAVPEGYFPFGAGQRKCVGIKIGQLHVKLVLSMILSEYEVYQDSGQVSKLDSRSTFTAAADGVQLQFTKLTQ